MPNLFKRRELLDKIESYEFQNKSSFKDILKNTEENNNLFVDSESNNFKNGDSNKNNNDNIEKEIIKIKKEAEKEARNIVNKAKEEAEFLKEQAKKEGYNEGYLKAEKEGYNEGYLKAQQNVSEENEIFFNELRKVIERISIEKDEIIKNYKDDLKEVAIAVAEKVIQVSLKSSGDIIERMILSATERLKAKEWAKIYISKNDAEIMLECDKDIVYTLSHISEHIKVVVMENEKQGTCIIEFPDEIIDASASTQLENIKEILSNS